MTSKSKDVIFLLGAGASAEAAIPVSGEMIDKIETLLDSDEEWKPYLPLYHHIKSAIHYAAGLKGRFKENVPYNIETLVNTLYELERNEDHPLYPFIASWNSRLIALSRGDSSKMHDKISKDFARVSEFRRMILKQLKRWVSPDDTSLGDYYKGFCRLEQGLNFSLRIFSLNYDRCVERLGSHSFRVEAGFGGEGPRFAWDWERFEDNDAGPPAPQVYLYKLHGSINWKRDEAKNLFCLEQTEGIEPENMEVIFGREFKLEAADPYLFYIYEFRKCSLEAKLIVSVGYGFGDPHIDKILAQALGADHTKKLLVISNCTTAEKEAAKKAEIVKHLSAKNAQVVIAKGTAKEFLEKPDLHKELLEQIPPPAGSPF